MQWKWNTKKNLSLLGSRAIMLYILYVYKCSHTRCTMLMVVFLQTLIILTRNRHKASVLMVHGGYKVHLPQQFMGSKLLYSQKQLPLCLCLVSHNNGMRLLIPLCLNPSLSKFPWSLFLYFSVKILSVDGQKLLFQAPKVVLYKAAMEAGLSPNTDPKGYNFEDDYFSCGESVIIDSDYAVYFPEVPYLQVRSEQSKLKM